jgi:hypothetical protein
MLRGPLRLVVGCFVAILTLDEHSHPYLFALALAQNQEQNNQASYEQRRKYHSYQLPSVKRPDHRLPNTLVGSSMFS